MPETPTDRPAYVLEDPSAKAVARVYTLAFLGAAQGTGVPEALEELTSFHDDVLQQNPEFARLLTSEFISREDKLGIIERIVQPRASELLTSFLRVLARHERLNLLPVILQEAWLEHERIAGQQRVHVKSAVPLSEEKLGQIRDRLQDVLSAEPVLIPVVDEDLLGGLLIQVGDTVYDGSLRTQLRNLRRRLRERYLNEIQSGRDRFSHSEGS